MSYSDQCLVSGETIIKRAAISKLTLVPTLIVGAILAIAFIIIGSTADMMLLSILGVFVAIIYIVINILVLKNIELTVTDKKLIGKTGVIIKRALCAPLSKIDSIYYNQDLLARIFGYGTLVVHTTHSRFAFRYIVDATSFQNIIMASVDAYTRNGKIAAPASPAPTPVTNTIPAPAVNNSVTQEQPAASSWTCPSCGTSNKSSSRFCFNCGKPKA